MSEILEHTITITQRKRVTVTGVCEIVSVGEQRVVLSIVGGKRLCIVGSGLKMGAFSKQSGSFCVEGVVDELKYSGERMPLIKKLLK